MFRRTFVVVATAALLGAALVVPAVAASASTSTAPIIIGGDGDLSASSGAAGGFLAGIKRFNAAGGLDGRKIEFTGFLDDGFSSSTNLTNAQQLVENKHVMVVAPFSAEISTPATATYLANAKVPFIGWGISSGFSTEPKWGYGITGLSENPNAVNVTGSKQLLAYLHDTKTPSKVKEAIISENIASAIIVVKAIKEEAAYVGIDPVYTNSSMPVIGTTNYAPYAQNIIASGANDVQDVLEANDAIGLAAALKAAGYKGVIESGANYYPGTPQQASVTAAMNGVLIQNSFPADEDNSPATKQAIKDLKSVGAPPYLTVGTAVGYWSALTLESMLKATLAREGGDPNKVTGATIEQTVNSGKYVYEPEAGDGIPMYFPAAEEIPTGCLNLEVATGSTYKEIDPYQCDGVYNVSAHRLYNLKTGKSLP